ncbi:Receptor-type tyrosine-protein phosphatase beta, partial [Camelus dromedarius]
PSPVKDISISPKTDSLLISWSRGSGNVERYQLMLMDKRILVHSNAVDKYATSYTFHGLTPGHLYNVTIVTEAAGLQNYRWKPARTTPMEVSNLKVTNGGSLTSLKAKWQRPSGNVDSYNVTLSHQGAIQESRLLAPQITETQFNDLTPGRLYHVTISCVSGELSAPKVAVGRTADLLSFAGKCTAKQACICRSLQATFSFIFCPADPLPPARFEVNKEKTTSTSLHVWWTPSSGKVSWYEVQLLDDKQKTQESQIQGRTSRNEYTFFNLTAGNKYNITITAVSGDKHSSTVYTNGSTVPSPVKDISISPKTDSLLISWSRGSGNVERYQLMLMDKRILVHSNAVDKYATSYTFHGLTPGHLYNVTIVTEAAGLQNYRWKPARTTPMEVSNLKVTNGGSLTSLKAKWQRPSGNVDSYNVTLSHQGAIQESRLLAPQITETQFNDLTPGRLYHVTISCVSGELSAPKVAVGRTVPEAVGDLEANSSGSTRSLVVSWSPPAGDWEWYRILLLNDSLTLLNITVGKEETHYVIDDVGLIPGRQYEVEVTVVSGNLKNSKRCQGRTVPLAVLHLRVKHANETSLSVMWQSPAAEWEKYITSLGDRDLIFIHKSLPKDAKEFTFTNLVPGRKYIATVTSISGDLKNSSSTKGRTGNIFYKL